MRFNPVKFAVRWCGTEEVQALATSKQFCYVRKKWNALCRSCVCLHKWSKGRGSIMCRQKKSARQLDTERCCDHEGLERQGKSFDIWLYGGVCKGRERNDLPAKAMVFRSLSGSCGWNCCGTWGDHGCWLRALKCSVTSAIKSRRTCPRWSLKSKSEKML